MLVVALWCACNAPKSLETEVRAYRERVCECADMECVARSSKAMTRLEPAIARRLDKAIARNPLGLSSRQDPVDMDLTMATLCIASLEISSTKTDRVRTQHLLDTDVSGAPADDEIVRPRKAPDHTVPR